MSTPIDQQNLIKLLEIESLSDEKKTEIIEVASELAQKRLVLRILDSLPKEKQEGLITIMDSGDEISLTSFLNHNAPNYQEWMAEEIVKIKYELQGLAKAAN